MTIESESTAVESVAADVRPRRSLLWVPGDQPSKLEKASRSGADVVVLDLEDGVGADRKDVARESVAGALRDLDFGTAERMVRICPGPDVALDVAASQGADSLCVPKIEGPDELSELGRLVREVLGAPLPILAISAESPMGVLNTSSMATAFFDVVAWMWGSENLAAALGCRARQAGESFAEPLAWARTATVFLAAATGAQAIDTVYPFFKDTDGLIAESRDAARAGFSGKGLIHPAQVAPVNDVFTPDPDEIARAKAIVDAFADGAGVAVINDQMIDMPHLRAAQRLLARAPGL